MYKPFLVLIVSAVQLVYMAVAAASDVQDAQVTFTNQGNDYEILSNVELIQNPQPKQHGVIVTLPQPPLSQYQSLNGPDNQEVLGSIGTMLLVKKKPPALAPASAPAQPAETSKVFYVRNLGDNSVGIVNGELFISLTDASKAQQIAREYAFVYRLLLPGTTTALMEAPIDDGFVDTVKRLRKDARITELEVRVITELPSVH